MVTIKIYNFIHLLAAVLVIVSSIVAEVNQTTNNTEVAVTPKVLHGNQVIDILDRDQIVKEFTLAVDITLVIVCYMKESCVSCKTIEPVYHQLAQKYDNVTFLRVDIDQCGDIAKSQKVHKVPTFILYRSQTELCRSSPGVAMSRVERKILRYLNSN